MVNEAPRVSLGVPVYNGERYLREALDSLLRQTYPDFEIIISDNASTDGTAAICEEYARRDPRIQIVRMKENQGASPNFNRVFQLARGEYFKWASADDAAAPEFLERCLAVLDSHPDVVLAYPNTVIMDETSQVKGHYEDNLDLSDPRAPERYKRFHRRFQNLRECNAVFGLIRSEALRKTRLIDAFSSSDIVLLSELALLGKFSEVQEPLFYRRDHASSSIRANPSAKTRSAWFDPAKRHVLFPRWKILLEMYRSIGRMGVRGLDWLRCVRGLGIWVSWNRKRLLRELTGFAAEGLLRLPAPLLAPLRWLYRLGRGPRRPGRPRRNVT